MSACDVLCCLGELRDVEAQLSEGGSSVVELEKAKKKLHLEMEEMAQSLEVSPLVNHLYKKTS